MSMAPEVWVVSAAAAQFRKDRRFVADAMAGVPPDGKTKDGKDGWFPATIAGRLFNPEGLDLTQEKARLAKAQADAQEIKTSILRGDVLLRGDVDQAVEAAFTRVKARMRSIAPKLAPVVVTATGPAEAQAMILTAIDEVLLELAGTTVADMVADDAALVADTEAAAEDDGQRVGGRDKAPVD